MTPLLRVTTPHPEPWAAHRPTSGDLERFRDYVQRRSGIFLEADRAESLRVSLIARVAHHGCATFDDYYCTLTRDEAEFQELLNLVTINETSFFRFPAQFDVLASSVIPELLDAKPGESGVFRVWSAGCSSGEEPYSIAMTLLDAKVRESGFEPQVVGTDVSTEALDRANRGIYPLRSLVGVPASARERFFEPASDGHRLVSRVRDVVDFSYHNLVKEPYPLALTGNWDVIFCRNVTIYFRLESTRRIVHRFFESLNPGGYLFVGHSETLAAVSGEFEPVEKDGVFLYRKPLLRHALVAGSTSRRSREESRSSGGQACAAAPTRLQPAALQPNPQGSQGVEEHLAAAHIYANAGDFASAIASCRRALNVNPLTAAARYVLGVIYQRLDDTDRAIVEFQRTICINPDFVLAHFNLANLYRGRRACADAAREYENALRALARDPEGDWTTFLDGFTPDLLAQSCERAVSECKKVALDG